MPTVGFIQEATPEQFLLVFWQVMLHASPYLLLGLVIAGILSGLVSKRLVGRLLARESPANAVKAALLGAPLPLCSCSVVPTAIALRNAGAGKSATQSFLISTPETGVDSVAITWAFFGPIIALARAAAAITSAILAGSIEAMLSRSRAAGLPPQTAELPASDEPAEERATAPLATRFFAGQKHAFTALLPDIATLMLLGLLIAALLQVLLPPGFLAELGSGLPLIAWYALAIIAGIPLYLCAASMTPIVAALVIAGLPVGVGLVFMLTGPATNAATIAIVRQQLGTRSVLIYLLSITLVALLAGALVDSFAGSITPRIALGSTSSTMALSFPFAFHAASAALLTVLLLESALVKFARRRTPAGRVLATNAPARIRLATRLVAVAVAAVVLLADQTQQSAQNAEILARVEQFNTQPLDAFQQAPALNIASADASSPAVAARAREPLAIGLRTLHDLANTPDASANMLIWQYADELIRVAGYASAPTASLQIEGPTGQLVPARRLSLASSLDGSCHEGSSPLQLYLPAMPPEGSGLDVPVEQWVIPQVPEGPVRVVGRLMVSAELHQPARPAVIISSIERLGLQHAGELGLTRSKDLILPRELNAPLLDPSILQNPPKPASLKQLDGRRMRIEGTAAFARIEPDGTRLVQVARRFFDGLCCGTPPDELDPMVMLPPEEPMPRLGQRVVAAGTVRASADQQPGRFGTWLHIEETAWLNLGEALPDTRLRKASAAVSALILLIVPLVLFVAAQIVRAPPAPRPQLVTLGVGRVSTAAAVARQAGPAADSPA